jgi:hypothetical protein
MILERIRDELHPVWMICVQLFSWCSLMYRMLLHLIRTSPSSPLLYPFTISSALANYNKKIFTSRFMYSSLDWRMPLSYQPHLSWTHITLPCRPNKKGSGFNICNCIRENLLRGTYRFCCYRSERFSMIKDLLYFEYNQWALFILLF